MVFRKRIVLSLSVGLAVLGWGWSAIERAPKHLDPLKIEILKRLNAEIQLIQETQIAPRQQQQQAIFKEACGGIPIDNCQISPEGLVSEKKKTDKSIQK